jgi:multiple sugar transport system ATP-binding protein
VAQFIGMPKMNMMPAKLISGQADNVVEVGVRPEHFALTGAGEGQLQGEVEMVEALGNETLIHVALEGSKEMVIVRQYEQTSVRPGNKVGINYDASQLHCFDAQGLALR